MFFGLVLGPNNFQELKCQRSETHYTTEETLGTFLSNLCMILAPSLYKEESQEGRIASPYKPVKKLLAEYLMNHTTNFTWLNLYLEKIRSKIFSMDNLIHKFVTPEGHEGYSLGIASILDIYPNVVGR